MCEIVLFCKARAAGSIPSFVNIIGPLLDKKCPPRLLAHLQSVLQLNTKVDNPKALKVCGLASHKRRRSVQKGTQSLLCATKKIMTTNIIKGSTVHKMRKMLQKYSHSSLHI